jgi:hypothetical protein
MFKRKRLSSYEYIVLLLKNLTEKVTTPLSLGEGSGVRLTCSIRSSSASVPTWWRSPRRVLIGIQDYYNRKGLVSDKGEHKKAWYVLKEWYEGK